MQAQTFVFLDLETTGLMRLDQPKPEVTELHLCAASRSAYEQARPCSYQRIPRLPRVLNKLTLCIKPKGPIDLEASQLTQLTAINLNQQRMFDEDVCTIVKSFLTRLQQPLCFVAHNGPNFDYIILQEELRRLNQTLQQDILYVDSCEILQEILKNNKAAKLTTLYQRFFGREPEASHTAEGDVVTLMRMSLAKPLEFVRALDRNAKLLELLN